MKKDINIIEPQRLYHILESNDKNIAIVNSLNTNIYISSNNHKLYNHFGHTFINYDYIDRFTHVIVYCASYSCSASNKYILRLYDKFPNYKGNILDYKGGILEWGLLSYNFEGYKLIRQFQNTYVSYNKSELLDIIKSYNHRKKSYNEKDELLIKNFDDEIVAKHINYSKQLLQGKVCVVTGATSGLGLETLKMMLRNGAKHVTGTYFNNTERASKVKAELEKEFGASRFSIIKADARTSEGNKMTFSKKERNKYLNVADLIGVHCVNINAGIFGPASYNNKHIHQIDIGKYDEVLNINLRGYVLGVQEFIRQAIDHKISNASIVCIKSIYGSGGSLFSNPAYQISKHGTMGLVNQVAVEFARPSEKLGIPYQIRINAVSPTFTNTSLTKPMLKHDIILDTIKNSNTNGQLATKIGVANAVIFLLSDMASDITGVDLPVDCGVLSEVVPTRLEVSKLNNEENIELLSCCGETND